MAQNTYAVSWFKGKELNMVFGFQLSVARYPSFCPIMILFLILPLPVLPLLLLNILYTPFCPGWEAQ